MNNWEKLSALLEKESEVWHKIYQLNEERMQNLSKEVFLQEEDSFAHQKEIWLEKIFAIQQAEDQLKNQIEDEGEKASLELQMQINQSMGAIRIFQSNLKDQEKRLRQRLEEFGAQIREEIKSYRNKKMVQSGYQAMPILEESALIDKKN